MRFVNRSSEIRKLIRISYDQQLLRQFCNLSVADAGRIQRSNEIAGPIQALPRCYPKSIEGIEIVKPRSVRSKDSNG